MAADLSRLANTEFAVALTNSVADRRPKTPLGLLGRWVRPKPAAVCWSRGPGTAAAGLGKGVFALENVAHVVTALLAVQRPADRLPCGRAVDAIRLSGPHATWREVGERLLADGGRIRTDRHEEDGCWPDFGA